MVLVLVTAASLIFLLPTGHFLGVPADAFDPREAATGLYYRIRSGDAGMGSAVYIVRPIAISSARWRKPSVKKVAQTKLEHLFEDVIVPTEKGRGDPSRPQGRYRAQVFPGYVW